MPTPFNLLVVECRMVWIATVLLIAAVATCDLVRTQVVVSIVVVARCLIPTCRFLLRSLLAASTILLLDAC
jgi:hypothetical protein